MSRQKITFLGNCNSIHSVEVHIPPQGGYCDKPPRQASTQNTNDPHLSPVVVDVGVVTVDLGGHVEVLR